MSALWIALTEWHAEREPLFALAPGAEGEARRLLDAQLRDPDTAVVVVGEEAPLEGLCIVRVDSAPPIHEETRRAEITDLYVDPAERRRGIASALVSRAHEWARERGASRVEVRVVSAFQNVAAHRLMELDHDVECDVIVSGKPAAREPVMALCELVPGLRALNGGPLDLDWRDDGRVFMTGPVATSFSGTLGEGLLAPSGATP